MGFEPTVLLPAHVLSRHAPSAVLGYLSDQFHTDMQFYWKRTIRSSDKFR